MKIAMVEAGHRIQLPEDWAVELGLENMAALEKTTSGILVSPCPVTTWDEIFARKLPVAQTLSELDSSEVSGDDLLF